MPKSEPLCSCIWSKSVIEVSSDGSGTTKGSSADRWFLGSLSWDSGQDNKWKVQLKVSSKPVVFKIQLWIIPPFQSLPQFS